MSYVQLHVIFIKGSFSPLHVTVMTAVKSNFILYTKQLFPVTCYCNDSCTVAFYPLYKADIPRYMLL